MAVGFFKRAEAVVGRMIFKLPDGALSAMARRKPTIIDEQTLHPQIEFMLSARIMAGSPMKLRTGDVAQSRQSMLDDAVLYARGVGSVAQTRDVQLDTEVGPLRARLYSAVGTPEDAPLLIFYHGGGFALGSIETHDAPCRLFAIEGGVHVLSVDYRLAPEHPFPAAVDDAFAAYRFVREHGAQLGISPRKVAVAGDSAGGNLSAVVVLMARDQGLALPDLQVLIYPTMELDAKTPSKEFFREGFFLELADMTWFRDMYVPPGSPGHTDYRCSPALAEDLSNLSPAVVVTAGFDPLRDEGEAYARRLQAAGVPTHVHRERALIHGYINMTGISPAAAEATRRLIGWTKERLAE